MRDAIGWASSIILLLTFAKQIHKQWQDRSSDGVSPWLFAGEIASAAGFLAYSVLLHNIVYLVTNSLMILNCIAGLIITLYHRRHAPRQQRPHSPARA